MMKTVYDLAHHSETQNLHLHEKTQQVLNQRYEHLLRHHPDLHRAEMHLFAKKGESEAHLIVHDSKHRLLEAHAKGRHLNQSIYRCFERAERQLQKPKHLRKVA
ncbi:HPF/RaiA family ribosome-associated protein [Haloferula sp.]|uniref:HPF/RaiA family ribosome-associated protein n=1 Tax=Haloferula sp. TaxID=2497595 RepID=UPI00329CBFC6